MPEENNQPQDAGVQEVEPVGAEAPQPAEQPEQEQLGAEEKPQAEVTPKVEKLPRTYTQEEWSQRESEKDKEISQYKTQLAQASMQAELYKMQEAEVGAKAKDQREVEEGVITPVEATQRAQQRQQDFQQKQQTLQMQQAYRQMAAEMEQRGRILAAQDFGKQYNLNDEQVAELLKDKDLKTPGDMRAKAADLALEKAQGELKRSKEAPPKFDQGQKGGAEETTPEKQLKERYPSMFKKK